MKTSTSLLATALLLTSACGQPVASSSPRGDPPLAALALPSASPPAAPLDQAAHESRGRRFIVPIDGLPLIGNRRAPVTLVEFTDYDCPFCARAEKSVMALRQKYGHDLRVAIAQHPLPMHEHARAAALTALTADESGLFEVMHGKLFERQEAHTPEGLAALGRELGLGASSGQSTAGEGARAALARATTLGLALKVTGTPTFFVNGRKISGAQPLVAFEAMIGEELLHAQSLIAGGVARDDVYDAILAEARANPADLDEGRLNEPAAFVPGAKTAGGAHFLGVREAEKTLLLFTDFECPYCAKADTRIRALVERHPEVHVVLRNHPLPMHPHARLAAKAALAAEAQGALAPFSALLFANQSALERTALMDYAARIGLDHTRFAHDIDSPETERRLVEDEALATALDVRGTPVSFVDGRRVVGAQGASTFEAALTASP